MSGVVAFPPQANPWPASASGEMMPSLGIFPSGVSASWSLEPVHDVTDYDPFLSICLWSCTVFATINTSLLGRVSETRLRVFSHHYHRCDRLTMTAPAVSLFPSLSLFYFLPLYYYFFPPVPRLDMASSFEFQTRPQ
ncbi:hypothetical protein V8C26DRAFT_23875 [Trichoderma gracile]